MRGCSADGCGGGVAGVVPLGGVDEEAMQRARGRRTRDDGEASDLKRSIWVKKIRKRTGALRQNRET
jgi:hypothetical protein